MSPGRRLFQARFEDDSQREGSVVEVCASFLNVMELMRRNRAAEFSGQFVIAEFSQKSGCTYDETVSTIGIRLCSDDSKDTVSVRRTAS